MKKKDKKIKLTPSTVIGFEKEKKEGLWFCFMCRKMTNHKHIYYPSKNKSFLRCKN